MPGNCIEPKHLIFLGMVEEACWFPINSCVCRGPGEIWQPAEIKGGPP